MIYDLVYGRGKKFNPERTTREIMELTPYGRVHFVKVLPTKEYVSRDTEVLKGESILTAY